MVVVVKIKNVILRGETYYFRMVVPSDCRKVVGKREISLSLKTNDATIAKSKADPLTEKWAKEFAHIRLGQASKRRAEKKSARPKTKPSSASTDFQLIIPKLSEDPVERSRQSLTTLWELYRLKLFEEKNATE
ncbi:MAG: hypothetical protein OES84_04300, partial [Kiritimatiellaceae bacterium]|nr:hypothetical protein [Kiritimatiellaceae bacterium]